MAEANEVPGDIVGGVSPVHALKRNNVMSFWFIARATVSTVPIVSFEALIPGKAPVEVITIESPVSRPVAAEASASLKFLTAPEATPSPLKAGDDSIITEGVSTCRPIPVDKFIYCLWEVH